MIGHNSLIGSGAIACLVSLVYSTATAGPCPWPKSDPLASKYGNERAHPHSYTYRSWTSHDPVRGLFEFTRCIENEHPHNSLYYKWGDGIFEMKGEIPKVDSNHRTIYTSSKEYQACGLALKYGAALNKHVVTSVVLPDQPNCNKAELPSPFLPVQFDPKRPFILVEARIHVPFFDEELKRRAFLPLDMEFVSAFDQKEKVIRHMLRFSERTAEDAERLVLALGVRLGKYSVEAAKAEDIRSIRETGLKKGIPLFGGPGKPMGGEWTWRVESPEKIQSVSFILQFFDLERKLVAQLPVTALSN